MAKGSIPGVRRPTKKEIRELLKLGWVHDEALSTRGSQARVLPDGRVLLYMEADRSGMLYPSRASAEEMKRQYDETGREAARQAAEALPDPCQTLLPPIDDFLRDAEAHARSLGPRLRIPDEVLDRTGPSLDAVDKALKRIPWAKRQVPDLVTPLVAYVGEVLRRMWDGQWSKFPATQKRQMYAFDTPEMAAWQEAGRSLLAAVSKAGPEEQAWAQRMIREHMPMPRLDVIDEPIHGHENEPVVMGKGRLLQPFAIVFIPMIEPSKRVPLRSAVLIDPGVDTGPAPPPPAMISFNFDPPASG